MLVEFTQKRIAKIRNDMIYANQGLYNLGFKNNKDNSISDMTENAFWESVKQEEACYDNRNS